MKYRDTIALLFVFALQVAIDVLVFGPSWARIWPGVLVGTAVFAVLQWLYRRGERNR